MAAKNTIVISEARKSLFPSAQALISVAVSFNQGDLLVLDTGTGLLKVPTLETEGSTFLGVATTTVIAGLLKRPYTTDVDASAAISDVPGPVYGVVASCVAKTGDAFAVGATVFLDPATGTRGVAATGTKVVGIYQGKNIASATAGQEILVALGARYPTDTWKF